MNAQNTTLQRAFSATQALNIKNIPVVLFLVKIPTYLLLYLFEFYHRLALII